MSVLNINTKKSLNLYIQNIDNSYYNNLLTTSSATLTYVDSTNKIKSSVYDNNAIYFINQQNNLSVNTIINYQKIESNQPYLIKSNVSVSINSSNIYITGTTDITGSLKMAGNAGFNGQVLASNGTIARWIDLPVTSNGGWVGLAQSDLNMNGRNISNVIIIDASGTSLTIGNTSSTSILIGKSGITTSFPGDSLMNNVSVNNLLATNISSNNISTFNLSVKNNSLFIGDVSMNAKTYLMDVSLNNLSVLTNATFANNVSINNLSSNNISTFNLSVKNNSLFMGDVSMNAKTYLIDVSLNNLSVLSNATFANNVSINNVSSTNLSTFNISVKGNATFDNAMLVTGQATFNTPINVSDPSFGFHAATKGYVDSLVGQYSGGFNLFFNYSQTETRNSIIYDVLSQTVTDVSSQQFVDVSISSGQVLVAQFITPQFNITQIPVGLWNTLIYGAVNDTTGTITYSFTLSKITAAHTITLLGTSANSVDINASPNNNPSAYNMNLTITSPITLDLTDSLIIRIFVNRVGSGSAVTVRTFFENNYYSFTQSTLNAGTTLISSNNTWTGTNNYLADIKSNNISSYSTGTINHNLWVDAASTDTINIGNSIISSVNLKGDIIDLSGTNVSINNASGRTTIGNTLGNVSVKGLIIDLSATNVSINNANGRTTIGNILSNVSVRAAIIDLSGTNININTGGSPGTNGQALISNGTNTVWSTIPSFSGNNTWSGTNTFSVTPYISTNFINLSNNTIDEFGIKGGNTFSVLSQPNYRKGFMNYLSEGMNNYSSMIFYSSSTTFQACGRFEFYDNNSGSPTNGNMSISFNTINIANNVNIGTTVQGVNTNTINIGSNLLTTAINIIGPIFINSTGTSTINIGNSGTLININRPLTPTYTYTAANGTNVVGTIGYILGSTGTATTSTGSELTIRTISSIPVGVWLLTAGVRYGSALTWMSTSISATNNAHDFGYGMITPGTGPTANAHNCNRIVVVTTGTVTYYLITNNSSTSVSITNINFQALRIA